MRLKDNKMKLNVREVTWGKSSVTTKIIGFKSTLKALIVWKAESTIWMTN